MTSIRHWFAKTPQVGEIWFHTTYTTKIRIIEATKTAINWTTCLGDDFATHEGQITLIDTFLDQYTFYK